MTLAWVNKRQNTERNNIEFDGLGKHFSSK